MSVKNIIDTLLKEDTSYDLESIKSGIEDATEGKVTSISLVDHDGGGWAANAKGVMSNYEDKARSRPGFKQYKTDYLNVEFMFTEDEGLNYDVKGQRSTMYYKDQNYKVYNGKAFSAAWNDTNNWENG